MRMSQSLNLKKCLSGFFQFPINYPSNITGMCIGIFMIDTFQHSNYVVDIVIMSHKRLNLLNNVYSYSHTFSI